MQTTIDVLGGMFDSTAVVETVDGFPRGDKAVDAAFFARMMQCFYSDGVVRPADGYLQVLPGDGMRLTVNAGCGWIHGHMGWVKEAVSAFVEAGHSYLDAAAGPDGRGVYPVFSGRPERDRPQ